MAQDLPKPFHIFSTAHGVTLEHKIPALLQAASLPTAITLLWDGNDLYMTAADAEGYTTPVNDRTFVAITSTRKGKPVLSGVTAFGQLMRLEQAVPTWHELGKLLAAQAGARWQALGWAAELCRLVGDGKAAKAKRARQAKAAAKQHKQALVA